MAVTQLTPIALPGRPYGSFVGKAPVIPGLALAAADWQEVWAPRWVLGSLALPERYYATQDLAFPVAVGGDPFVVGDSDVGGEDLVGGGAGSGDRPAHGNILNAITVTRRLVDLRGGQIDVPEFEVELANPDGALQGDYTGTPGQLWRYDEVSRLVLPAVVGVVSTCQREPDRYRLRYTGFDLSIFEEPIPKRLITLAEFPLAAPDAVGKPVPWVLGNVENLPLPCVRDDQAGSEFDYLLTVDDAAALTGLRRVMPGGGAPFVEITADELEPYPGMARVLVNGTMEDWDAGPAVEPTGWTKTGAGATVAKTITAAQVSQGSAAAALTAAAAVTFLIQDLMANAPELPPSWWQGREATIVVDALAVLAGRVTLRVADGTQTVDSAGHTGGGTYEPLTVGTVGVPFIIGAAATALNVSCRINAGAATTVYFDNVRVYLRAKSFNECLRPDFYLGLTAVRFFLRQEDAASGAPYRIVADVRGNQPARNPIRAISTILEHPTAGLGRAVDPVTFAEMEAAICFTHEDAINLDGPEFFLPIRDAIGSPTAQTMVLRDRSGHERHGTYDKGISPTITINAGSGSASGEPNDAYIDNTVALEQFVSVPEYWSGQAVSLGVTLYLPFTLPDAALRPIVEKLIGETTLSGHAIYRENNLLKFSVRGADTVLYTVTSPLVDVTDEGRWFDVVGTAENGVLLLYRDGVLAATGSYTGLLAEGYGGALVAKFGTGSAAFGVDRYDNLRGYTHALSAARVAAQHAAIALQVEPVSSYDIEIQAKSPTFRYRIDEDLGDTVLIDWSANGHDGTWVGGPALGAPGPLTPERGWLNSGTAAHFQNDVSKYGVETGMTLADTSASIPIFYRPSTLQANAGICEKTIGGVRGTQWGFCQRAGTAMQGIVRFTVVAASGTHTLDAPILAEDVGRYMWLVGDWSVAGVVKLYKNGAEVASTTVTPPMTSGVGDFYVGCQGTNGGGLTRPAQGDIGRISYHAGANVLDTTDIAQIWLAATWYNGGLCVDMALTEPRQAQDILRQICLFRGIRFGVTPEGAITVAADIAAPTTIRVEARDGPGAGELTLIDLRGRTRPPPVKDVVVRGARDLLSGAWGVERRRTVHAQGEEDLVELDVARTLPTLDRIASYRAARRALDETVTGRLTQEARQLREGELVQVTHAHAGYAGDVLEAHAVTWGLEETGVVLREWDEALYDYLPEAFPSGTGSE